ncbi:hypothetical protein NP233_g2616 [Leucocoprinus birnbaumii]|uniref:EF-hand domain-containing protein n=1 Tax=Leucocoprinus birnbaumii TaxID=56174 RepID=A0AAD5VXZ9_9AGAR|nr:hypothetical protein NP233_g2616 [Leucocoprinus birnbaumii]
MAAAPDTPPPPPPPESRETHTQLSLLNAGNADVSDAANILNDPPPPYPSRDRRLPRRSGRRLMPGGVHHIQTTHLQPHGYHHQQLSSSDSHSQYEQRTSPVSPGGPGDHPEDGEPPTETTLLLAPGTTRGGRPRSYSHASTMSVAPSLAQTVFSLFQTEGYDDDGSDSSMRVYGLDHEERSPHDEHVGGARRKAGFFSAAAWKRYFRPLTRRAYYSSFIHLALVNFPYALAAWIYLFVFTVTGTTLLVALPLGAVLCFFNLLGARAFSRGELALQYRFHYPLSYPPPYPPRPIFTRYREPTLSEIEGGRAVEGRLIREKSFYKNTYAMFTDSTSYQALFYFLVIKPAITLLLAIAIWAFGMPLMVLVLPAPAVLRAPSKSVPMPTTKALTPSSADTTEAALTDVYFDHKKSKDGPGRKEQKFDEFGNGATGVGESPLISSLNNSSSFREPSQAFNNFYSENSQLFADAAAGFASLDNQAINRAINGFPETVKVVLDGLDVLGKIHPFVSVKNPTEVMPDGSILKDQLQNLMEEIIPDLKSFGQLCDHYLKKSFVARTLKSKIYEARLQTFGNKFIEYKDQLDKALTVHIALVVEVVNNKLDDNTSLLRSLSDKVDNALTTIFRKLDTPREKEVMDFILENGGPDVITKRGDLVRRLVDKSGETLTSLADKARPSGKSELDSVRDKLQKEVAEDLDVLFQQNFELFNRKLELQNQNIQANLEKQGQYVIDALSSGAHDKIRDPDLQSLWIEMEWKGSVKARHFVLALRDYYTGHFSVRTPHLDNLTIEIPSPSTEHTYPHLFVNRARSRSVLPAEKWGLQYITFSNLSTIAEAIDDDGTGFISIREANTFANERPKSWGLLPWIAFWAKGWETSIIDYKAKITEIIQKMDRLRYGMRAENKCFQDIYLLSDTILGIYLILRSTLKGTQDCEPLAPELQTITQEYIASEEGRLRQNLEAVNYYLDSPVTVRLVAGPGRIERYLFPLLYLVLKRHLEVCHYAFKRTIGDDEFFRMVSSLISILQLVGQRIEDLKAIHERVNSGSISSVLKGFSLGMFHEYSSHNFTSEEYAFNYGPEPTMFMTQGDASFAEKEDRERSITEVPEMPRPLLPLEDSSDGKDSMEYLTGWPHHSFDADPFTGQMLGFWTGHLWTRDEGDNSPVLHCGLTQLKVDFNAEDDQLVEGYAVNFLAKYVARGRRRTVDGIVEFDIILSSESDSQPSARLIGTFIAENETLVGSSLLFAAPDKVQKGHDEHPFSLLPPLSARLTDTDDQEDSLSTDISDRPVSAAKTWKFIFRRTPAEVAGFCSLPDADVPRGTAKSRWAFLRDAVLHLVRVKLWSRSTIRASCADRSRLIDVHCKSELNHKNFSLPEPLKLNDLQASFDLRYRLPPLNITPSILAATWKLERMVIVYLACDGCGKIIWGSVFTCLSCVDLEMTASLDLCTQCSDKPAERKPLIHTVDHTLMKSRQCFLPYSFSWQLKEARSIVEGLRRDLSETDDAPSGASVPRAGSSFKSSTLKCSDSILICETCEVDDVLMSKGLEKSPSHHFKHPLVRLHRLESENFEPEKVDPVEARINDLETAVAGRLAELDTKIDKVDARLASFEALLQKIAIQLNITPKEAEELSSSGIEN